MSAKHLFSRTLAAAPERLHMAAHSHYLWPDASFAGQVACWEDAARLADAKWDRIMGEVWPAAQAEVAAELGTGRPDAVVFAANTHDFLVRLAAACPRHRGAPLRVLTTDGEFHSARRQLARWAESGDIVQIVIAAEPFETLAERFLAAAQSGDHDLILVSQVLFGSGRLFGDLQPLADLADPEGPWVVVDGYHSFMALEHPLLPLPLAGGGRGVGASATARASDGAARSGTPAAELRSAPPPTPPASGRGARPGDKLFFLAGGYKYAMSGEGMGLMHCPPGFGPRPPVTGWYAEFADLTLPPGMVGYAPDAMRFMGATFDASALYRFLAVREMLAANGFTTATISARVAVLQAELLAAAEDTPLASAELLNPLTSGEPHARFLAFRSPHAAQWQQVLADRGCTTDVRGDVLRVGLGLYHDSADVARFAELARQL